jgi:predicted polyphosphate/ATP-dependent NAD kinase
VGHDLEGLSQEKKWMNAKKKLGLVVNPIAGMGGRVGLKGSDGQEILDQAKKLGAQPESPKRTVLALKRLISIKQDFELITCPCDMGENEALECNLTPTVIEGEKKGPTSDKDTKHAASEMLRRRVDLLLFAGGDGTARDIYSVIGDNLPALGIPSGVKIHSAAYAMSPGKAGELAVHYLSETSSEVCLTEAEVMDIDEQSFRENQLSARLFGYLKVPFLKRMLQGPKAGGCAGEQEALNAIATEVINNMENDCLYIVGTGTTTRAVMDHLGLDNTLLGVDAVYNKALVGSDLNEAQLLSMLEGKMAKIIVGVIGNQGYIFGRGNQQISAKVINKVGKDNILVLATLEKIATLKGAPLFVDTGDEKLDRELSGYMPIISGLGERVMLKVES